MSFFANKCKSFDQDLPKTLFPENFKESIIDVNNQANKLLGYAREELPQ